MHSAGKFLQAVGLVIPLIGFLRAIQGDGSVRGVAMTELGFLAAGALVFLLGTALVKRAGG